MRTVHILDIISIARKSDVPAVVESVAAISEMIDKGFSEGEVTKAFQDMLVLVHLSHGKELAARLSIDDDY